MITKFAGSSSPQICADRIIPSPAGDLISGDRQRLGGLHFDYSNDFLI